ncbi:dehydrogenase, partial [Chryseobacterium sp. HMWF028]
MNIEKANNLFSEHRLSSSTLDFIENIKFLNYQVDAPEKFEVITYVNYNPEITKKIFNSYYEVGLCPTFPIKGSEEISEEYNILKDINSQRKSIRKYNNTSISYEKLGDFLKLFYSITREEEITLRNDERVTRKIRNIASGGGMYSCE